MQKQKILATFICLCSLFLVCSACSKENESLVTLEQSEAVASVPPSVSESAISKTDVTGSLPETSVLVVKPIAVKIYNPLTHQEIDSQKDLPIRAMAVSIGNNPQARPQSGLAHADIVYEVPAEGGVSRYVGIFYGESVDKIGPVRSARPYIVRMASQFSAGLAHVGGSNDALALLDTDITPDMNEFSSAKSFWRSKDRKAPNNCYTSTEKFLNWYENKKYTTPTMPIGFSFLEDDECLTGENIAEIKVTYLSAKNCYKYNAEDGLYYRYISDKQQVDPEGDIKVACANVIVQYINSKVLDDEGRLAINLYEGGNAIFFVQGKMIKGSWTRKDDKTPTVFYDDNGKEMKFAVGKTWIQMVDKNCSVSYE